MAGENLLIGPNAVVSNEASDGISFADAGFTGTNCAIIYLVGAILKSYVPGRPSNGITELEAGKGYYIVMKQAVDKTAYFYPPIPDEEVVNPIYAQSAFTAADNTLLSAYVPEEGPAFAEYDGTWHIVGNKATNYGSIPTSTQWVALLPSMAGILDVKLTMIVSAAVGAGFSIWLRASGTNGANSIIIQVGETPNGDGNQDFNVVVYSIVGGTATELSNTSPENNIVNGADITAEAILIGNTLSFSMNGTSIFTGLSVPSGHTDTKYGFGTVNATTAEAVKVNSLVIEDPTP